MQCSSCQFENMPGTDYCGRCGTSLRLSTAAFDVYPPRAGRWAKRVRRAFPLARALGAIRDALRLPMAVLPMWMPPLTDIVRLSIPGWPQRHRGQRLRASLFLGAFLLLLLGGALLLGATWGSILLGLAFAVHSASVFDATTSSVEALGAARRILRSALLSMLLGLFIYTPIGIALGYIIAPIVVVTPSPPLVANDVLLVQYVSAAAIGRTVLYNLPNFRMLTGNHGYTEFGGQQVDRILAGPGSQVLWEHGRLLVDGVPSELRPLNPLNMPPRLQLTVPKDCFLILPTTVPYVNAKLALDVWQTLSVVPRGDVVGTVYFRYRPFSRMGRLP